jgi:N-acetylglucosamine kinase
MEWVLGLDGGGSKTLLALANLEGQILGPVAAEGINPFDNPAWKTNLLHLFNDCPRPLSEVAYAVLGMPGYGEVPAVSAEQTQVAVQVTAGRPHSVLNDVQVAFVGALAGEPGVLVLSGTGSMAWAGWGEKQIRVGGWGDGFGDEGSAYWIGHRALGDLSKALDGRIQDPTFAEEMLRAIGAKDITELLAWFYGLKHPRSHVARLAKTVDTLADLGNPTALKLLGAAAGELTSLAQTAFRLLGDPSANRFSYAGSVFNSNAIRTQVRQDLASLGSWQPPVLPPIGGALLYAARQAGWPVGQGWVRNLQMSLGATGANS